jgi:hypothetical protein
MSKPINEYTMQECLDRLYDVVGHGYDRKGVEINVLELAWRIDKLLYEQAQRHDARVDALENEINALRAKHRWIPVEERLPTQEDGDRHGYVQWWSENEVAIPVAHYWDFTGVPKHTFTHWRRNDKPDSPTPSGQVAGMRYE